MPYADNDSVKLYYETFGDPAAAPLLMVSGLGDQCTGFDDELCERFTKAGFFLIRFDNRDTGLSTHFESEAPDVAGVIEAFERGDVPSVPYSLAEMAGDLLAVLDAVGVDRAHVFGVSLGGFIVQRLALDHPDRMQSMTLVMSNTGDSHLELPTDEAIAHILEPASTDRDGWVQHQIDGFAVMGSPGILDEARERAKYTRLYDRSFDPDGRERQMMAVVADGGRGEALRSVRLPTLVLHGDSDTLIRPSSGRHLAEMIPGSRFVLVKGMGHDMPEAFWDTYVAEVSALRESVVAGVRGAPTS